MKRSLLPASFLIGFVILLGAGCQQTQPVNQKDQINNPSTVDEVSSTVVKDDPVVNSSLKTFVYDKGGFNFEYPSEWVYEIKDENDQLRVDFFVDETHRKNDSSIMYFATPVPDMGFETMRSVENKKYSINNSMGSIESVVLKYCVEEPLSDPCKVREWDGFALASWAKDLKFKPKDENNYKEYKNQSGIFSLQLAGIENKSEEQELLAIFDEILKSFKFNK